MGFGDDAKNFHRGPPCPQSGEGTDSAVIPGRDEPITAIARAQASERALRDAMRLSGVFSSCARMINSTRCKIIDKQATQPQERGRQQRSALPLRPSRYGQEVR